jgi:hypothetical protein
MSGDRRHARSLGMGRDGESEASGLSALAEPAGPTGYCTRLSATTIASNGRAAADPSTPDAMRLLAAARALTLLSLGMGVSARLPP